MKIKSSKTTIILYVLAVLLVILASIQLFEAITYIMSLIEAGSVTWGKDFNTIISYISQSCVTYYAFAVLFYVLAKMYQMFVDMKANDISYVETKEEKISIEE